MGKREEASSSDDGKILKLKKEVLEAQELMLMPTEKPKAKERKTKVIKERLPLGLIKLMMEKPYKPIQEISPERLATLPTDYCEGYALRKYIADKLVAYEQALVDQYLAKGYADDETEVTDDETEVADDKTEVTDDDEEN